MRLRHELLALILGIVALLALLIVVVCKTIMYEALRKEKGQQLTTVAYQHIHERERTRMEGVFAHLTESPDTNAFNQYRNALKTQLNSADAEKDRLLLEVQTARPTDTAWLLKANRLVEGPGGEPLSAPEVLRYNIWTNLRSLYEQLSTFVGSEDPELEIRGEFELLVVGDPEGRVLVELLADRQGRSPELPPPEEPLPVPHAPDLAELLKGLEAGVPGYILYPDGLSDQETGSPYSVLWTMDYFGGDEPRGVMMLGNRMDNSFAQDASEVTNQAEVRIVIGDEVVSWSNRSEQKDELSLALEAYLAGPEARPILADYKAAGSAENDIPPAVFRLGIGDYLVRPLPLPDPTEKTLGYIFFMQSMDDIAAEVRRQTQSILYVWLGSVALCLLVVPLLAPRFTRPIDKLSGRMVGVPKGELTEFQESEITGAIELRQAARAFNEMITGLRQKMILEGFVPLAAREEIETSRGDAPRIGGRRLHATILFSDLRGFTSLSEKISPDEVMALLSEYLDRMTRVIRSYDGDINEYIGDAILAVFKDKDGVRSEQLAVRAALEMNRSLDELQKATANEHLREMRQGIGIHSGELVEGYIGTQDQDKDVTRMKLAVIGDTVNLAARIQDRSRDGKHTCILVSDVTRSQLPGRDFELDFFGDESFKGKSQPVPVWEVMDGPV